MGEPVQKTIADLAREAGSIRNIPEDVALAHGYVPVRDVEGCIMGYRLKEASPQSSPRVRRDIEGKKIVSHRAPKRLRRDPEFASLRGPSEEEELALESAIHASDNNVSNEFETPDECLHYATRATEFVATREALRKTGITLPLYDRPCWKGQPDNLLPTKKYLDGEADRLRAQMRAMKMPVGDIVPAVFFPFPVTLENERPASVGQDWLERQLLKNDNLTLMWMPLLPLRALIKHPETGLGLPLRQFTHRAAALLMALRLGSMDWSTDVELVAVGDTLAGLQFDGERVRYRPAEQATCWV